MECVLASKFVQKIHSDHWGKFMQTGIVPVNDIYKTFWRSLHRYEVYYGGRGSGKSRFIAQKLVNACIERKYFKCIYVRKGRVDIKDSMYEVLRKVIIEQGLFYQFKFHDTTLKITYIPTGNCFIARGMDDPQKSKSIEEPTCIWVEEATELIQEDFITLDQNLRTNRGRLQAFISFNPVHEEHWLRSYFFHKDDRHMATDNLRDCTVIRSTLYNNSFINQEQYAAELIAGASGNQNIIRVVLEGDWGITENNNPWLHAFSSVTHVKPLPFLDTFPVYLTFDFNANPLTCTAWQMSPDRGGAGPFLHAINEFGGHIKLEDICQQIKSTYPATIFFVTGDRSGQNEDVGHNQTSYEIIQSLLHLSEKQMNLNTANLEHSDSRLLCNAMFYHYPILIDPKCKNLIIDCQKATIDIKSMKASQLLKDREQYKMDYFDGMRYLFQTYFNKFIKEKYLSVIYKGLHANKKPLN